MGIFNLLQQLFHLGRKMSLDVDTRNLLQKLWGGEALEHLDRSEPLLCLDFSLHFVCTVSLQSLGKIL